MLKELEFDNAGVFTLVWYMINHSVLSILVDIHHAIVIVENVLNLSLPLIGNNEVRGTYALQF